jgi:hypothetical protein
MIESVQLIIIIKSYEPVIKIVMKITFVRIRITTITLNYNVKLPEEKLKCGQNNIDKIR